MGAAQKLVLLAVIGGTIGLIMNILSRKDSRGNTNIIGQIVAGLIGVSWTIVSYFALPVILTENVGVIDSFKKSVGLVQKSWGEGMTASISLMFLYVPGVILLLAGIFLSGSSASLGLGLIVLGVLALVAGYVVTIPVKAVISQALYVYATKGTVPSGFEADKIAGFYQKN
ncbi:MAG TPA: DUF6159 family protein, partial [Candidatus Micrarchaeota archaeon]|nr:DUF6159 family protein [Candidatus Micrarchaeota archaeon]